MNCVYASCFTVSQFTTQTLSGRLRLACLCQVEQRAVACWSWTSCGGAAVTPTYLAHLSFISPFKSTGVCPLIYSASRLSATGAACCAQHRRTAVALLTEFI